MQLGEKHHIFCSTGLPPARTRWFRSRFSSHCPLSSNQRHWLASATSIIFPLKKFWECWDSNLGLLGASVLPLCYAAPQSNKFYFFTNHKLKEREEQKIKRLGRIDFFIENRVCIFFFFFKAGGNEVKLKVLLTPQLKSGPSMLIRRIQILDGEKISSNLTDSIATKSDQNFWATKT